jgi:hypothetical protein
MQNRANTDPLPASKKPLEDPIATENNKCTAPPAAVTAGPGTNTGLQLDVEAMRERFAIDQQKSNKAADTPRESVQDSRIDATANPEIFQSHAI